MGSVVGSLDTSPPPRASVSISESARCQLTDVEPLIGVRPPCHADADLICRLRPPPCPLPTPSSPLDPSAPRHAFHQQGHLSVSIISSFSASLAVEAEPPLSAIRSCALSFWHSS